MDILMLKLSKILSLFHKFTTKNIKKIEPFKDNKIFSIDELNTLKKRLQSGETPVKIAHSINISYKNFYRIMQHAFPGEHGMLSPKEMKRSIIKMHKEGVSVKEISQKFGYIAQYIYMLIKEDSKRAA